MESDCVKRGCDDVRGKDQPRSGTREVFMEGLGGWVDRVRNGCFDKRKEHEQKYGFPRAGDAFIWFLGWEVEFGG